MALARSSVDHQLESRQRRFDGLAQRVGPLFAQQAVRILPGRQPRRAHAQAFRQQDFEAALQCALAGTVTVEEEHHVLGAPQQRARVLRGQRGAAGRERSLDTGAAQRDLVEVALDDHRALAAPDRLQRARQAVEHLALVEDRRLRRVQVLRLLVLGDRATAEAEDASARIADRKGHAPAQPVVVTARVARRQDAGRLAQLRRDALAAQHADGEVPAVRREADLEALPVLGRETARREIRSPRAIGAQQLAAIARLQQLVGLVDPLGDARFAATRFGDRDPAVACEAADRLEEAEALGLLHEVEDVSAFVTAEAVERAPVRIHVERGRLLVMEGAEPLVAPARALEGDATPDELDHVDAVANLLDDLVGNPAHGRPPNPNQRAIRLIFLMARFLAAAAFFFLRTLGLS